MGALGAMFAAQGCGIPRPDVPDNLKAPAGEEVILVGHATRVQIYVCQAGMNPHFAWVFKVPEADLTDSSGKGSSNTSRDRREAYRRKRGGGESGCETRRAQARRDSLVAANGDEPHRTRRFEPRDEHPAHPMEGGVAPEANTCDASTNGKDSRSANSADYYFLCARALSSAMIWHVGHVLM